MKEKWEGTVSVALITFLLVIACIGWAKYVDETKEVETWYARYSDEVDERLEVKATLDDTEFMRQACVVDRDFYKNALDATPLCKNDVTRIEHLEGQIDSCTRAYSEEKHDRKFYQKALEDVPAYCSLGLNQFVIDGLEAELSDVSEKLTTCVYTREYFRTRSVEGYNELFDDLMTCREHKTQCGWDMCACNDGFEGCPIYVLEYYTDQAVCRTDTNCKNCMWQMVDNGGGLDHDEILWCLEHAFSP